MNKIACVQSPTINLRFTLQLEDLTLCMLSNFHVFFRTAGFSQNPSFSKNSFTNSIRVPFRNTIRVPNSLDPDQNQHFVGSDLGPNYLQRLSADGTSKQS